MPYSFKETFHLVCLISNREQQQSLRRLIVLKARNNMDVIMFHELLLTLQYGFFFFLRAHMAAWTTSVFIHRQLISTLCD